MDARRFLTPEERARLALADEAEHGKRRSKKPNGGGTGPGEKQDALREELTELGNAHRLARRHGANLRYCWPFSAWFVWTGVYWKRDDGSEIRKLAEETVESILTEEMPTIKDKDLRTSIAKWYARSQSRQVILAMVELTKHQPGIPVAPDELDADPMLLGVRNGVIELRTGTFRKGRREDYITHQAAVCFDATAQCPNWLAFQEKISKDPDLIAYKQRVYGLMLTGLMVEVLFILHGEGGNGKTTELETIFELLGDYAWAADASILIAPHDRSGPTPEIVALKGKRLLSINETREGDSLNEQRVKALCSTEAKTGRGLHEKPIDFKPTYKDALKTNPKPKVRGTDHGLWRRLHLVPYLVRIHEDEAEIRFRETKLQPERSGILNWQRAGLRDYLKNGERLKPPKVVCAATDEYRREQDVIGQWAAIAVEMAPDDRQLSLNVLYSNYSHWAENEIGWTATRRRFAARLRELGFESVRSNGVLLFEHIQFKEEEQENEDQ